MEIKKLYQNYLNKIEMFMGKNVGELLINTKPNFTLYSEIADLSNYIVDTFKDIKFEQTDIELPIKFLFMGDKILYNESNLNYEQDQFNNYIHSQIAFILSGRWLKNNNKQCYADKNVALIWLGRFEFEKVSISYSTQSLNKIYDRKANSNIKYWVPTVNEKQLISNNLIYSNINLIKQKDNIYYIPNINLCTHEYHIGSALYEYKLTYNKTLRILNVEKPSFWYTKINDLLK